jgi:hypothetical protein
MASEAMKDFRSHHHPPSLDFSWRNVQKPAQEPTWYGCLPYIP